MLGVNSMTHSIRAIVAVSFLFLSFCTSAAFSATTYTTAAETMLVLNIASLTNVDTAVTESLLLEATEYGYDQVISERPDSLTHSDIVDVISAVPHLTMPESESKAALPAPGLLLLIGLSTSSVGWMRRRQMA